jgi:hypothetical protein
MGDTQTFGTSSIMSAYPSVPDTERTSLGVPKVPDCDVAKLDELPKLCCLKSFALQQRPRLKMTVHCAPMPVRSCPCWLTNVN